MMSMENSFYFSNNLTHFLFEGWSSYSGEGISLICLFSGILALLAEFCSLLTDHLHIQASQLVILQPTPSSSSSIEGQAESQLVSPLLIPSSIEDYRKTKIKYHCCQTLVHVIRLVIGYILMLAVMTFNAWIGISVIIGCGIGYFLFGVYRENWRMVDNTSSESYGSFNNTESQASSSAKDTEADNPNDEDEDSEEITEIR